MVSPKEDKWVADAHILMKKYESDPLFMLGIGLYWGEGSKYGSAFEITNSDPGILKVWLQWLKRFLPDFGKRFTIFAHEDVQEQEAIKYWSNALNIKGPIKFYRAVPKSSTGRRKGKLPYGTFRIATKKGAKESRCKMMIWLDTIAKQAGMV